MSETISTKSIPRISAKRITAANLLRQIKAIVLEEPRRVRMSRWITMFAGRKRRSDWFGTATVDNAPACGTVACIAGWGAILLRAPGESPKVKTAEDELVKLVGYKIDEGYGEYWSDSDLFDGYGADVNELEPGTAAYARAVARRIDKYLRKHPDLESRIIDVKKKRVVAGAGV